MIFELALLTGVIIIILAFVAEYFDSSLGMGYGTSLTPLLLLMGFEPLQIVPAILLSEFVTGVFAGVAHNFLGNVDFKLKKHKKISEHLKIALTIAILSSIGTLFAVFVAVNLPSFYLKLYIGVLVLAIGLFILLTMKKRYKFSWKKITALSLIASFNKGISGGGYGPVITGGQLLSGVEGKSAIGITSLAEGLTCAVGVIAYLFMKQSIDWSLAPYLLIGATISVPLSAYTVKKANTKMLRLAIGIATLVLGSITLINLM